MHVQLNLFYTMMICMKHTILCVDDEIDNVEALERLFRKKYTVLKATSAAEGLDLIKKNQVSLIISDQRMPRKTGVEFFKESIQFNANAMRILLTGYTDIDSVIDAINAGEVYRYITKPWDPIDLANTVDKAIEKYELTAALKEKNLELQRAYDELKTLDDAKNSFMILINHELKTPLTVILSFLELLLETELSAEQKKYCERILLSSNKLKRIIDDVLSFVSAETGLLKISKTKVSSKEFITQTIEKYKPLAENKNQQIKAPRKDYALKADPQLIGVAFERLLDNAIKFGDENTDISVELEDVSEDHLRLSIVNSGKPLPQKSIDKILKPFTLDEDVMQHSQGLGLSLSLTQALLKRHSSALFIDCPKGQVRASFDVEKA